MRVCQLRSKAVSTWWLGRLYLRSLGTLLSSRIFICEVLLQGLDLVVKDGVHLLAGDAFEIIQELVDGGALSQGFEQRGDGQPGVLEDPGAAHFFGVPFDGVTVFPVAYGAVSFWHFSWGSVGV